ncbi:MAG: RNA 2',3'-cyclic phosphodiesterase [Candidatus Pacearchaeota archaeon]
MKCFIAVEVPENVRSRIFHAFENLKKSGFCKGNFVRKDNLHLTIKFLGDISPEKVEEVKQALNNVSFQQFPVETGDAVVLPDKDNIKSLWLGLKAHKIEDLKRTIDEHLKELGFEESKASGVGGSEYDVFLKIANIREIENKGAFFNKLENSTPSKTFFIADQFSLAKSSLNQKKVPVNDKGKKKRKPAKKVKKWVEYKPIEEYPMHMKS